MSVENIDGGDGIPYRGVRAHHQIDCAGARLLSCINDQTAAQQQQERHAKTDPAWLSRIHNCSKAHSAIAKAQMLVKRTWPEVISYKRRVLHVSRTAMLGG